jgi:uncharacterized protein
LSVPLWENNHNLPGLLGEGVAQEGMGASRRKVRLFWGSMSYLAFLAGISDLHLCSPSQAATRTYDHGLFEFADSPPGAQSAVEEAVRAAAAGSIPGLLRLMDSSLGKGILHWEHQQTGVTPLSAAAFCGHLPVVDFLLRHGARIGDPNRFGWTPIMSAALGGWVRVLRRLIEHGAGAGGVNLDQQDADGCTALWWACCLGNGDAAELLIYSGAKSYLASDWGMSPFHVAVQAGKRDCVELFWVRRGRAPPGGLDDPDDPSWCICADAVEGQVSSGAVLRSEHQVVSRAQEDGAGAPPSGAAACPLSLQRQDAGHGVCHEVTRE